MECNRITQNAMGERILLKYEDQRIPRPFANLSIAADRGFLDAVIQPREMRKKLIQALETLETKRDMVIAVTSPGRKNVQNNQFLPQEAAPPN